MFAIWNGPPEGPTLPADSRVIVQIVGLVRDEQRKKNNWWEPRGFGNDVFCIAFLFSLAKDSIIDTRKHIPDQHWWLGEGDDILWPSLGLNAICPKQLAYCRLLLEYPAATCKATKWLQPLEGRHRSGNGRDAATNISPDEIVSPTATRPTQRAHNATG